MVELEDRKIQIRNLYLQGKGQREIARILGISQPAVRKHLVRKHLVKLSDRREFKVKVIGTDPKTDIAVIKINSNHLPVIRWGDSDKLKVGEQ